MISSKGRHYAAILLASLFGLLGRSSGQERIIDLGRPKQLVLVEMRPNGAVTNLHEGRLFRIGARLLEARAGLVVRSADQAGIELSALEACRGPTRISCWTRVATKDGARATAELTGYLVILQLESSSDGSSRMTGLAIDTDAALRLGVSGASGSAEAQERMENQIFENATSSYAAAMAGGDDRATERLFEGWFDGPLRSVLERNGDWGAAGSIELISGRPGLTIRLNGRKIGSTASARTLIVGARAGPYELEVETPGSNEQPFSASFELRAGESVRISGPSTLDARSGTRRAAFWAGIGLAALGAGLSTYSAIHQADRTYQLCLGTACGATSISSRFTTFSELGLEPGYVSRDAGSGVPIAPLGYSLAVVGATWALGATLLGKPDEAPWLILGLGIVAGVASFGVSEALD